MCEGLIAIITIDKGLPHQDLGASVRSGLWEEVRSAYLLGAYREIEAKKATLSRWQGEGAQSRGRAEDFASSLVQGALSLAEGRPCPSAPTWPGVQGLVGLMKILGLELGLLEAPLRGPWGVIWRSVPPVLSWSLQRANSQPGWLPTPLLRSSGWARWREGSHPCALWAWNGCGGWGWATRPLCPPAGCCPRAKPLLTRAGLWCGPWMALGPSRGPSWQIDGE